MAKRRTPRQFGKIKALPSGRFQASYVGPDQARHNGPHTFDEREDAEAWLAEVRRAIRNGSWSQVQPTPDDDPPPLFGVYAAEWLEHRQVKGRPLRPRTVDHYTKLLDQLILPTFGDVDVDRIESKHVRRWYQDLRDETGPTMRAHAYALLRGILATAVADELIVRNPCTVRGGSDAPRASRTTVPTLDQLDELVAAMPERMRPLVLLTAWCALRFGEVTELRRSDVELGETTGVVHVYRAVVRVGNEYIVGPPKSDAGIRDVTVPPHVVRVLREHLRERVEPAGDALLFPTHDGDHLPQSSVSWHFHKARDAAGLPGLRFHDLRHVGLTLAAHTGATLAELMARAGHSTSAAALRYQHATVDRSQTIAEALSRLAASEEATRW